MTRAMTRDIERISPTAILYSVPNRRMGGAGKLTWSKHVHVLMYMYYYVASIGGAAHAAIDHERTYIHGMTY